MKNDSPLEVPATDFVQDPDRVMNLASRQPVRIIRLDGAPLVLGTEADLGADAVGVPEGVAVMTAYLEGSRRSLGRSFTARFPWMAQLTQPDRDACVHELIATARTCAADRDFELLAIAVAAWRDTAELRPYVEKVMKPLHWLAPE